ncbi:MAG: Nif11-like leader peptide family natural product precursor [Nostoc sp. CmiVER01]|uniref:Nif11-like leader peptide family natural product precursor n=1 Tax=Nostoc sp. CmiVER01 TaxID=3075384 RepID=UPI002AD56B7E|nr:Nif11-like leader peptide family natural product precursor [Nostoc sp. CmiVER01]MDZ8126271.1 Nif11-like leader peptide family natural product precursor [Nostoc sp. CmiVER01]
MSIENVQAFYAKLANDEAFRAQIQGVKSKEECSQRVKAAGYDFTQNEFEEYTAQLLESTAGDDELKDLNEEELEAVFGGAASITAKHNIVARPLYGVIISEPIDDCPHKPPIVQPLYGVIQSNIA